MSSPLLLKTNKFDDEFLSMLKLRGYAIYSFGYLKNQVESKIVNAITTELQSLKVGKMRGLRVIVNFWSWYCDEAT